jgi:hypothetical protein
MIKKILKIICWPFTKAVGWLASGLPSGKKEEEVPVKVDHCATHSRYKKSCPACKAIVNEQM